MNDVLVRIVNIAASALESEDRFVLGCLRANRAAYPEGDGGILRINNERYYQFIITRALFSSFEYLVKPEVADHDLIAFYPSSEKWFAVVEMKRWMSPKGKQELPAIRRDVIKLREETRANLRLMLIFSANPEGSTKENIKWLCENLDTTQVLSEGDLYHRVFQTVGSDGQPLEFWVGAFEVEGKA